MINLLRALPSSKEENILTFPFMYANKWKCHCCMEGNEGNFVRRFHSFLQVFEMGFMQKISNIHEEE